MQELIIYVMLNMYSWRYMVVVVVSQFNGTSTPKGSYSAKPVVMIATSIQVATV